MFSSTWSDEFAWQALVADLRNGDAVSVLKIHHRLVPNIEWMLRRYGALHPRRVARHICHETVLNIQSGKIHAQTDVAHFLREQIRAVPSNGRNAVLGGAPDLRKCRSRESELAIRYYILGESREEICRSMQLSPEAFQALKKAAFEIFRRSTLGGRKEDDFDPVVCAS